MKPAKGEVGELTDATMVLAEISERFDDLTPAQQEVYQQAVTPAADAIVVDGTAASTSGRTQATEAPTAAATVDRGAAGTREPT